MQFCPDAESCLLAVKAEQVELIEGSVPAD